MSGSELADMIKADRFLPELKAAKKEDVLVELLKPLVSQGHVKNKALVLATLRQRENLGSTGLGKGVAIPHCRTLAVTDLHITVGISREGIDFEAVDRKKVYVFFLIIAPPHDEFNRYLPLLGKIVELVRDGKKRKALLKAEDFESFKKVIQGG